MPSPERVLSTYVVNAAIVEPMEADDEDALYDDRGDEGAVWDDFSVVSHYERDGRRYMLGVTAPTGFGGDTAAFVQLAKPTLLWIAHWTIARWKEKPPVPKRDLGDDRWVWLDEHLDVPHVTIAPDGVTPFFRISGLYVYGCKRPAEVILDDAAFAKPPWLDDEIDRSLPQALLERNIIDTTKGEHAGKLL